jgi:hypothetical protein
MADSPNLPYVLATGRIEPLFQKIQEAQIPPRFTQDFLDAKLGLKGGSATPLIPLLKRIGFLENDGLPTDLYRKFRNPEMTGAALAQGIRKGYAELYSRNEYAHDLSPERLSNLIVEITGKQKDDRVVKAIVATFTALKAKADFGSSLPKAEPQEDMPLKQIVQPASVKEMAASLSRENNLGLNLSYTINLTLPETDDINVYNAIFKSLKENMLKG